ncbi:MAG: M55 family metallopeptidase [Bacillota bacterium]
MKVYMSVDMEGASGVSSSRLVSRKEREYERGRKLLTGDVNAAVRGALEAGAEEVLVNDAHGSMTNILVEDLEKGARLITGSNKQLLQMAGIDETFAAAFFVAYHAREGTENGVLNHTIMGSVVTEIRRNGEVMGETGINAGIAGVFGVPVVLVTGDDRVAAEASALIPGIETAVVKTGLDRHTASCLPPGESQELIRQAAARALQRREEIAPHRVESPVVFDVTFKTTPSVNMACLFPSVERTGSKQIRVADDDYLAAFKKLWGALLLGSSAMGGVLER